MKLPDNTNILIVIAKKMRALQIACQTGDDSKKKDRMKAERMFDRDLAEFEKQISSQ